MIPKDAPDGVESPCKPRASGDDPALDVMRELIAL